MSVMNNILQWNEYLHHNKMNVKEEKFDFIENETAFECILMRKPFASSTITR